MTSMDAKSSTTNRRSKWAKKNDLARSSARGWPTGPRRFGLWGGAPSKWGTRRQVASFRGVSRRQRTRCKALKNEEIGVAAWSGTGFAPPSTWRLPHGGGSLANPRHTTGAAHVPRRSSHAFRRRPRRPRRARRPESVGARGAQPDPRAQWVFDRPWVRHDQRGVPGPAGQSRERDADDRLAGGSRLRLPRRVRSGLPRYGPAALRSRRRRNRFRRR